MKKPTEFQRFHGILVLLYLTTFAFGLIPLRQLHPYSGMALILLPALYYGLSPKKRAIKAMIKSNFKKTKTKILAIARISTVLMMMHIFIMVLTGSLMFFKLYTDFDFYMTLLKIHQSTILILPLLVVVHVVARLLIKFKVKL